MPAVFLVAHAFCVSGCSCLLFLVAHAFCVSGCFIPAVFLVAHACCVSGCSCLLCFWLLTPAVFLVAHACSVFFISFPSKRHVQPNVTALISLL
jgi:hypothetical protein